MTCSACGAAFDPAIPFCPSCGAREDDLGAPPPEEALASAAPVRRAPDPPTPAVPPKGGGGAHAPAAGRMEEAPARGQSSLPEDPAAYLDVMQEVFGFPGFRPGQEDVLRALGRGDVLAVMSTGAGKSLCYVLPALLAQRTVVVSPLIALMQDQVEALQAVGVPATFINSTVARAEQNARYAAFRRGEHPLLFVAPERFRNEAFVRGLRAAGVSLLAIDEAHCISEWGHDFRPDYLALGAVRERLGSPRTLALTATADPQVRADIARRLNIDAQSTIVTSFDRPNLRFAAERVANDAERVQRVVRFVRERAERSGIVYARTRRSVEDLAEALRGANVRAVGYHAGMPGYERARVQRQFVTGDVPVIVATNAFGMGIDKPDVRWVLHAHLPGRLEAYYQEAGRAGRDGDPAECLLLWAAADRSLQQRFIRQAHPDAEAVRRIWRSLVQAQRAVGERPVYPQDVDGAEPDGFAAALTAFRASGLVEPVAVRLRSLDPEAPIDMGSIERRQREVESRLARMAEYAETTGCRRAVLLRYFGQDAPERCDNCDACAGTLAASAGPTYPSDLFTTLLEVRERIARTSGRAPYAVFEERTAREIATYRPASEAALLEIWGMGEVRVRWFGADLLKVVRDWEEAHPDAEPPPRQAVASRRRDDDIDVPFDDPLFRRLREWRLDRARREEVPAYTIFTDRTARELVAKRPRRLSDLLRVYGLGDRKVQAFGEELLAVIEEARE